MFEHHRQLINNVNPIQVRGRLDSVVGMTMRARGLPVSVGSLCAVHTRRNERIVAQAVGFQDNHTVLMPLQDAGGAAVGDCVSSSASMERIPVGPGLLGRVLDGMGRPIDGHPPIHPENFYPAYQQAPAPLARKRICEPLGSGIRAVDAMLTVGTGQRVGIFSGTGVGKSVLLGMVARYTAADVTVVALVGERGREVRDFIEKNLGPEGSKKAVLVVSTSDQSPVLRVRACFVATAIAEYFRDQGRNVLLLMDSLTRLAMAQRQIGLATGEPPATKGYTPSVFSLLPKLLERTGKTARGSITGFYAVLVEGDDISEPISDAVRGILDGHVWLSRTLAGQGHYPSIDVLNSISRLMVDVTDQDHLDAAQRVRNVLATWSDIEDLVNIGAYAKGTNPQFDLAIQMKPRIDAFLRQNMHECIDLAQARAAVVQLAGTIAQAQERPGGA